jgi:hypothetical protein
MNKKLIFALSLTCLTKLVQANELESTIDYSLEVLQCGSKNYQSKGKIELGSKTPLEVKVGTLTAYASTITNGKPGKYNTAFDGFKIEVVALKDKEAGVKFEIKAEKSDVNFVILQFVDGVMWLPEILMEFGRGSSSEVDNNLIEFSLGKCLVVFKRNQF